MKGVTKQAFVGSRSMRVTIQEVSNTNPKEYYVHLQQMGYYVFFKDANGSWRVKNPRSLRENLIRQVGEVIESAIPQLLAQL
jgi:hypothetical protein